MYGLDYVALRYFNVYGPRMDIHGRYTEVMVRWMERIEAGLPPIIFGDGLQTMDMVHVRDVARANILAADGRATDAVFNVGSETETSLLELARRASRAAMGRPDLVPVHRGRARGQSGAAAAGLGRGRGRGTRLPARRWRFDDRHRATSSPGGAPRPRPAALQESAS